MEGIGAGDMEQFQEGSNVGDSKDECREYRPLLLALPVNTRGSPEQLEELGDG